MSQIKPLNHVPATQVTPRLPVAIFDGPLRPRDNTIPIHLLMSNFQEPHFELLKRKIIEHLKLGGNVEVKVGKTSWYFGKVAKMARRIASWESGFNITTKRLITVEINNEMPNDPQRTYVIFKVGKLIT